MVSENTNAQRLLRKFIEEKIREIAYERYVSRTKPAGELDDWLHAESEVLSKFGEVREVWSRLNPSGTGRNTSKIAS